MIEAVDREKYDAMQRAKQLLSDEFDQLQTTITAQEDIIKRLKEDADRLADGMIMQPEYGNDFCCNCGGMEHAANCPITLHTQLMNELGERQ